MEQVDTPEKAAKQLYSSFFLIRRYASELQILPKRNGIPVFDALLLGMGPDGHTCSLFPNHKEVENTVDTVTYIEDSPKPPKQRITLTLPVLNNASHIFFIVTGKDKKSCLDDIRNNTSKSPSSLVSPLDGDCIWFVDNDAYGIFHVCSCKTIQACYFIIVVYDIQTKEWNAMSNLKRKQVRTQFPSLSLPMTVILLFVISCTCSNSFSFL